MTTEIPTSRRSALAHLGRGGAALIAGGGLLASAAGAAPSSEAAVRQMDPNPAIAGNVVLALKIQELTGGPSPRLAEAYPYFAEDILMEIGIDGPVAGKSACLAYLPTLYRYGLHYSFEIFSTQASGAVVTFSRIDRIFRPGVPERALPVVAVFMFRKGLLRRWFELPAYLDS